MNPHIIQGKYKGYKLNVPPQGTRPFTDRVKKTLFDIMQGQFQDKTVLDLFAGTGNLGLEAISSGATFVTFVDISQDALKSISDNVKSLGVEHFSKIIKANYKKFIKDNKEAFDIIFIDPPFKLLNKINLEEFLPLMHQNSILILKSNKEISQEQVALQIIDKRKIGINFLYFIKKS